MSSPSRFTEQPAERSPSPPELRAGSRAPAPDIARGLMLALIALANVMIYLHARPYGLRQHIIEDGWLDKAVTAAMVVLVDGRAYPLFACLFGYGLVRIADRARMRQASEREVTKALRRRSFWLIMVGLVHALIAFSGDVLGWYGLLGVLVASCTRASGRTLLWFAGSWLVVSSAIQGLVYSKPGVSEQRGFLWSYAIADPVEALGFRVIEWVMTPFGLLSVVSALLVGMWAGQHRILEEPDRQLPLLRRVALWGIPVGALGGIPMALATVQLWDPPYPVVLAASWLHILTGVLAGFGYLAAITLITRRHHRGTIADALRATGERSLSAYLLQTVVFGALLPAHTLALGATMSTSTAAGLALATWVASVLIAQLYAAAGWRGPAEALMLRLRGQAPRQHAT